MRKVALATMMVAGSVMLVGCGEPASNMNATMNTNVSSTGIVMNMNTNNAMPENSNALQTSTNNPADATIRVTSPARGATVTSGMEVSGQAAGWYFEGSFGLTVLDDAGTVLYNGAVTATDDWMTTAFVPFKATVTFAQPTTRTGKFIFKRSNPSGLPEHDESFEVPVTFAQ